MTGTNVRRITSLCSAVLFVLLWVAVDSNSKAAPNASNVLTTHRAPEPGLRDYWIEARVPLTTATRPPSTFTPTRTVTPSPTPGVCPPGGRYRIVKATGTVVPGVADTGNHCDDCYTPFVFPFPVRLYENTYTQAQIGSNGLLVFGSPPSAFPAMPCDPLPGATYTIFAYWSDLVTNSAGSGVFTRVMGSAPNRELYIEWRATYFKGGGYVNFHIHFTEGA